MKKFYRARLEAEPEGLCVVVETYASIYETECYHYCIRYTARRDQQISAKFENPIEKYRAFKKTCKIKKIAKRSSRFAFKSREDALGNLRYRKTRQVRHLKRELAFADFFLSYDEIYPVSYDKQVNIIPESKNLVNEYLRFN